MARVQVVTGERAGEEMLLDETGDFLIGTGLSVHLQLLEDPNLASIHCKIYKLDGEWWVEDNQTGFVFLNLVQVEKAGLLDKDLLFFGKSTVVRFFAEDAWPISPREHQDALAKKDKEIEKLERKVLDLNQRLLSAQSEIEALRAGIQSVITSMGELNFQAFERFREMYGPSRGIERPGAPAPGGPGPGAPE